MERVSSSWAGEQNWPDAPSIGRVAPALGFLLGGCGDGAEADEQTIELARQAYQEAKARGVDVSPGPVSV